MTIVEIRGNLRDSAGFAADGRIKLVDSASSTMRMMMMMMRMGTASLLGIKVFVQLHSATISAAAVTAAATAAASGAATTAATPRSGGGGGGIG